MRCARRRPFFLITGIALAACSATPSSRAASTGETFGSVATTTGSPSTSGVTGSSGDTFTSSSGTATGKSSETNGSSSGTGSRPSSSSGSSSSGGLVAAPWPAADAGYLVETFNSTRIAANGGPWQLDNFYGQATDPGQVIQTQDGGMILPGTAGTQGGVATAHLDSTKPNNWGGIAFGGGAYLEATYAMEGTSPGDTAAGWPAWWASDIERAAYNGVSTHYPQVQWQGQDAGYQHYIEVDVFEADVDTKPDEWGTTLIDWSGMDGNQINNSTRIFAETTSFGSTLAAQNAYGVLWVPATATAKGSINLYFNRHWVGTLATWDQYNPALPPTKTAGGGLAPGALYSVIDSRHLFLILSNNNPNLPITVTNVQVWQASDADNLTE